MFDYKNFLLTVPEMPGCYIMKDERDTIIYIGKAKNLKNRLKNYFPPVTDSRLFVTFLLDILKNVEIIVTKSEYDAIILEITLIKLHKPKYNIVYKDSSPELYLYLNEKNVYQTLEFTNVFVRDEKYCIGPFFSSFKVKEIVDTLNKAFLLRSCSDNVFKSTKRVCLEYHIKRCSGACENKISKEDYFKSVENLKRFLNGEHKELLKELKEDMLNASENLLFEKAIKLRDEIKVLEYFITKKFKYIEKKINIDIVSYSKRGESIALTIIVVRNGLIIDQKIIEYNDIFIFESEIITSFIIQYYNNKINFPAKVIIANDDINLTELNDFFTNKFVLKAPESEEEIKLSSMAKQNGDIYLEKEYFLKDKNDILLKSIMNTFSLINYPDIIECFDNSNLFGKNPVASKVEFRNGFPFKKGYKLYKIKTIDKPDDYGTMKEVIKRRLTKGIKENELPDLIVVDGGKGQLNAAYEIFKELNVEDKIDLLSIAKIKSSDSTKDQYYERVFKVGDSEPIILKQNSDEVILFVKLRDEAHRFAITFHKKLRDEKTIKSILDDIEGIGPKRKKILLKHFKSIENIKKATLEELQKVEGVPKDLAKKIFNFFI